MDFCHKHKLDLGNYYSRLDSSNYTDNLEKMSDREFHGVKDWLMVKPFMQLFSSLPQSTRQLLSEQDNVHST